MSALARGVRTRLSVMRLAGLARRAEQAERERGRWAGCGKKRKEDGPWKGETGLSCWALRGEGERGSELGRFVGLGWVWLGCYGFLVFLF